MEPIGIALLIIIILIVRSPSILILVVPPSCRTLAKFGQIRRGGSQGGDGQVFEAPEIRPDPRGERGDDAHRDRCREIRRTAGRPRQRLIRLDSTKESFGSGSGYR